MKDFFSNLRIRRSVLKRTTKRKDLPEAALYIEWLQGIASRKIMTPDRKEQVLTDLVLQSNYKLVSGQQAENLIADHWSKDIAAPQQPVRNDSN